MLEVLGGASPPVPGRRELVVARRVEVDVVGSGRVLRGAVWVEEGAGEAIMVKGEEDEETFEVPY